MHQYFPSFFYLILLTLFSNCQQNTKTTESLKSDKPNIILIVADDHGTDDLGCYGNNAIQTPNLDQLASEGVRFTKAYCTTASCSASRSVILTGLYNHANGQYGHQHSYNHFSTFNDVKSLPVLLHENGYTTARIGKYHVSPEQVYLFDHALKADGRNAVEMARISNQFINENKANPFFLYFCTSDPHRGGGTDEHNPHNPNRFGNRDEGYSGVTRNITAPKDVIVPGFLPDNSASRAELSQYYESVNRIDQGVGELVQFLRDAGLYDYTIIIYISDNGIAFPGAKTNLYDAGMRLPCIIRNPLISKKHDTCDAMINWADLTPTILDFAGVYNPNMLENENTTKQNVDGENMGAPVFPNFHGRSFKQVMENGDISGWDETYASHTFHEITMYYPMRVTMSRNYKLIWNIAHGLEYPFASDLWASATWQSVINDENPIKMYGARSVESYLHRPKFELYDIKNDPLESHNYADDPKYVMVLNTMKAKLKDFQQRTQDPWIVKWEHE